MKQIYKRICNLMKEQELKKNTPNPIIIYESDDTEGERAYKEFCKKYPDYNGAVLLLPEKESL